MKHLSDRSIALFWLASGALLSAPFIGEAVGSAALILAAAGMACVGLRDIEARQQMERERRNWIPPLRFVEMLGGERRSG